MKKGRRFRAGSHKIRRRRDRRPLMGRLSASQDPSRTRNARPGGLLCLGGTTGPDSDGPATTRRVSLRPATCDHDNRGTRTPGTTATPTPTTGLRPQPHPGVRLIPVEHRDRGGSEMEYSSENFRVKAHEFLGLDENAKEVFSAKARRIFLELFRGPPRKDRGEFVPREVLTR